MSLSSRLSLSHSRSARIAVFTAAFALVSNYCLLPVTLTATGQERLTALVTVVADAGGAVTDLTAADFVIREDKANREVVAAERFEQAPLYVYVLVDMSKPPMGIQAPVRDMRAGVAALVAGLRASSPDVHVALMHVGNAPVPAVGFDAPAAELDEAIARLSPGLTADAALLEGIADAARALKSTPTIRRAIVALDFNSPEGSADRSIREVADLVQDARSPVWSITIRGNISSSSKREAGLKAATDLSGGFRLTAMLASGLETLMTQVANSLTSQYLVTFAHPAGPVGVVTVETTTKKKALLASLMR